MHVDFFGKDPGIDPFDHFSREKWSAMATRTPLPLTATDVENLATLGDPIDLREVDAIYRPLSALLQMYVDAIRRVGAHQQTLTGQSHHSMTPFIIGVAGSVAVGKSTVSRLLRLLLSRWARTPRVDLVTTDGFLHPNKYLNEHGLMDRKGFPESYDRSALLEFVARIKSGEPQVKAPVYSHVTYDIVPGQYQKIDRPNIVIIEGLNVLQPPRTEPDGLGISVADFFDFRIFVDANPTDIEQWYVDRFLQLRNTAFSDPDSYFRSYADLTDTEAIATAKTIWNRTNLPNLAENVEPTRPRATLILRKGADHRVEEIALRKI